ncbi:Fic family protein, partial [Acidobacteria bacterium AH-259-D05]|nr:Fic family protein [Acidobacteria bacterium AH-259-D05]
MHFPLKSALQFASLDKKKQLLNRGKTDLPVLIQEFLLPKLLEYELAKEGREIHTSDEMEVLRSQAQALFGALLELEQATESLTESHLLDLYALLVAEPQLLYRQKPAQPLTSSHEPVDSAMIPRAMDRFFEWVRSPSFGEMHAIEQMTLSQMRLYEIQPFAKYSHLTVSLFCLYFLLRREYLPPLYQVEELPKFYKALEQAFVFSTESLVHFNT